MAASVMIAGDEKLARTPGLDRLRAAPATVRWMIVGDLAAIGAILNALLSRGLETESSYTASLLLSGRMAMEASLSRLKSISNPAANVNVGTDVGTGTGNEEADDILGDQKLRE